MMAQQPGWPGNTPGHYQAARSENSFPETRTRRRSEPEKNQRNNPPTSKRYMSEVSLRDPTDKRYYW